MVVCCICGVEWVPEGVSFHKFPKSDNIRKRWLAAINKEITNFMWSASSKICGQHFTIECFIVTETGRRYLRSYAVPSVFNMPLKKKYILTQSVQTDGCDVAIVNEQEPCSTTTMDIVEVVDSNSLQESCVPVKIQDLAELGTQAHSELLDISVINGDEINEDQRQTRYSDEYEIITDASHEGEPRNPELHPEITDVNKSKTSTCTSRGLSTGRRQRRTKYGTVHSSLHNGVLDISLVNEELVDAQRATERNEILRKKLKTCQQKCRRLQRKVTFLSLLIKHLQSKKLSPDNCA